MGVVTKAWQGQEEAISLGQSLEDLGQVLWEGLQLPGDLNPRKGCRGGFETLYEPTGAASS